MTQLVSALNRKLLLATLFAAAHAGRALRGAAPRRRLRDTVDLGHVREKAEAEALTGALSFKLAAAAAAERGADKLADEVAELIACASAKRVFRPAGKHEAKHHAKGLHLWYAVKCAADDEGALEASRKAASKLEAYLELSDEDHAGVAIIEPGLVHLPLWTPNDPRYSDQQDHYDAVNLAQAWDTTQGNPNVVVQVLDTGLDLDHPDLQANIWRNEGEICDDGVDNDNNGFVDDCHGYNHADDAAGPASSGNYLGSGSHGSHCPARCPKS